MTTEAPPTRKPLTENDGVLALPWLLFFNQCFNGDAGTPWTPKFQNLTEVGGAATITGRYYRISQYLCYFNILVTPATNTSAVAGTTFIDNFPLTPSGNGICASLANNLGGGLGMVNAATNRIYVPSWGTVTTPINIVGIVEAVT